MKVSINLTKVLLLLIGVFSVIVIITGRWSGTSGENYKDIIRSDGNGYFNYFEAVLGENSIGNQKENGIFLQITNNNRVINKYFVGTALLMSPFVIPVYLYEKTNKDIVNFKSEYFQKSISIASLFYLLIGMWALSQLLVLFKIDQWIIFFSIFTFFFATNLMYYTIVEPSMSHVYSFSLISIFLLLLKQQVDRFSSLRLIPLMVIFALIILVRPINILILLFIPFLVSSNKSLIKLFKQTLNITLNHIIAILFFLSVIFIQFIFFKLQTDSWVVWSYSNEGFYFTDPKIFDFLFSFRKGLFVYTPLLFLTILTFFIAYTKQKRILLSLISFLLILIYILSSWWNWYYGDSYGARVMVDFYPVFIILLALTLKKVQIKQRILIIVFSGLFIILNFIQSYQYFHMIMSRFDMTVEKYAYIFGKTGKEYENSLGGNDDIVFYHKRELVNINKAETVIDSIISINLSDPKKGLTLDNGRKAVVYNEEDEHCMKILLSAKEFDNYKSYYAEISNTMELLAGDAHKLYWTITYIDENNTVYYYKKFRINNIPLKIGDKKQEEYRINIPNMQKENDIIRFTIWNHSQAKFILSDIKINISGVEG